MKAFVLYIFFFICAVVMPAQNKKWILGSPMTDASGTLNSSLPGRLEFYECDFTGATPVFVPRVLGTTVNSISSVGINETLNSTTDSAGNISFYVFANSTSAFSGTTSDVTYFVAFDSVTGKDEVFASLPSAGTGASSAKDLNIVRKDGAVNQYYVIYKTSCTNQYSIDAIRYVTVNMNAKTISSPTTLLSANINEGMAVSLKNCTLNNRWFFSVKYSAGNMQIYRSSISSIGISLPVLVYTISIPGNFSLGQGDIEISPTSDKIAFVNYTTGSVSKDIVVFDFNLSTGAISNERWIDNPNNYIIEIEFSPDGQRLYAFRSGTSAIVPELYNILVPAVGTNYTITPADRLSISFTVGHTLEMAYDGKLYFATYKYNTDLHYISNPNANASSNILLTTAASSFGVGNAISFTLPEQIDGDDSSTNGSGVVSILSSSMNICSGESVTLSATGGSSYLWSGGGVNDSSSVIVVSPIANTNYFLTSNSSCGFEEDSVTILVNDYIPAQFSYSVDECTNLVSFQNLSLGSQSYYWNLGDGIYSSDTNPSATYQQGVYNVVFTTNPNLLCADSTQQIISVTTSILQPLSIPNVFTPNNDGENDEFKISNFSTCSTYTLIIFNRWGQKVFDSNDSTTMFWAGLDADGNKATEGVYFYILSVTDYDKKSTDLTGCVSLIR